MQTKNISVHFYIQIFNHAVMEKCVKHLMYILSKTQDRKFASYLKNNVVHEFTWPLGNCISKANKKNKIKFLHQGHKHYTQLQEGLSPVEFNKNCWIKGK